ncbi:MULTISPECIES: hypothetical protein [Paenibacillus]|nr:hypothetical protein [Paenibacillus odorifer]MEC0133720.1 hypothetical protein [Paenibacillus odorifer]
MSAVQGHIRRGCCLTFVIESLFIILDFVGYVNNVEALQRIK